MMPLDSLKNIIEAALLAADRPLSVDRLSKLFDETARPSREEIHRVLAVLLTEWEGRGIELKEIHSGFRFQVRRELMPWISRLWEERPARYSRALLETLALIAYRQPITRGEIEEIRGVSVSSSIMRTLQEREWVRVLGHREVPGRPALYGTTSKFLDHFNLRSLNDLPSLAEIKKLDEPQIELTLVKGGLSEKEAAAKETPLSENALVRPAVVTPEKGTSER